MGLAASRALALALDVKVAGVSTLEALAASAPGALPVIDARRREIFTMLEGEPVAVSPNELSNTVLLGRVCVGNGAVVPRRARGGGAEFPDESELHVPRGRPRALRRFGTASSRAHYVVPPTRTGRP